MNDQSPPVNQAPPTDMQIISPAFTEGSTIPAQYTCTGKDVSPPLSILNTPDGAQSLAIIMHDPDAPMGDYVHWLLWDVPASTASIAASSVPVGAIQGTNSSDEIGYIGPCPPAGTGTHRYIFELYALDRTLGLPAGATRKDLEAAMKDYILAQATLTGLFVAKS